MSGFPSLQSEELVIEGERWLMCPSCRGGSNNLHHTTVHVFALDREEDSPGTHVEVSVRGEVKVDRKMAGNPSSRRHGLTIDFWCENCLDINRLQIAQHKGITTIEWHQGPVGQRKEEDDD